LEFRGCGGVEAVGIFGRGCGWNFGGVVVWRRSEFLGVVVVVVA
jgi:hypothetical protein